MPASLLKAHLHQAEQEFLAANPGYHRVPKQKKQELLDAVKGALMARTLPVPMIHDAVWDTQRGVVNFASLSRSVIETFEAYFKKSFPGFRLLAIHPFGRAHGILEGPRQEALLAANKAGSEDALDLIVSNRWLGEEFLLWVMYRTMNSAAEYRICRPGPANAGELFTAYLNDRLVLYSAAEDGMQKVTVLGPQDRFSEVRTALQQGKKISESALHFERGEEFWKVTLKGEMFYFASFKAPKVREERDNTVDGGNERESLFFERMALLESGLQLFDSLFASFLAVRLDPEWQAETGRIGAWLDSAER